MAADGPTVGERFAERYRVDATLGIGGMGAVYRVHDEVLGEDVALKTLTLPFHHREEASSRFRREVRLSRKVTHPNVARTYDLGVHGETFYLTMQLVTGGDLASLLQKEAPLAPRRVVELAIPMLEGLAAAHAAGVIHRDLKPANVLLDADGRPVLTDFGIARAIEPGDATIKTGGLLGTPAYMAPEQVAGQAVDVRTDVYSAGLIIYEMLTAHMPFDGKTPIAIAVARLHQPPTDPRSYVALPAGLGEAVLACLALSPDDRPSTASAVVELLRAVSVEDAHLPAPRINPNAATMLSVNTTRPTSTSRFDRRLAILPFQYRGPPEHAYIAEAIGDELVDELARVRGLVVLSSGATRAFRDQRDPRTVRTELGADAVVDGSMQTDGKRIRISARLDDATSGTQLWSDRFEGGLEDVFALQDTMRRRIAESLRVGITTATRRGDAPAEAIDCYLRARGRLRAILYVGAEGALPLLERALELAPDFAPALAAYATASIRAWFVPGLDSTRDFEKQSRDAVAKALALAGDLAETHHAAGTLALHDGDVPGAMRSLHAALGIAPTYVESLETLGLIECEIGRVKEGTTKLRAALDLDPTITPARIEIARQAIFDGDSALFAEIMAGLEGPQQTPSLPYIQLRLREAAWRGDSAAVARITDAIPQTGPRGYTILRAYGHIVGGTLAPADAVAMVESFGKTVKNARFMSLVHQFIAEALSVTGALELAEQQIELAARARLIDLRWMDFCPALAAVRDRPSFRDARVLVVERIRGRPAS